MKREIREMKGATMAKSEIIGGKEETAVLCTGTSYPYAAH
jgi:hypothetical protein